MKTADRIVSALLSLAVIPTAIFAPILHWIYQILGYDIVNSLLGGKISDAADTGMTEDNVSLYWLYDTLKGFGVDFKEMFAEKGPNPVTDPIMPFIKAAAIFFVITLVIALVTGIVSAVTNAKKTRMVLSGCGIVSLIGMMVSFNKFAAPIINGDVTIGSLFDLPVLSFIAKVYTINLSSAWVFMVMLFAAVILWTLSFILTSDKEEKNKKTKKTR